MELSRIEKVNLREVWTHEALDFSKWLAKKENLELLSAEIGIDIVLIQTEASVGSFSVDILAEEENTGSKIVIENQLEVTDHDHLGKIITYASGYNAEIIIWIVKKVRDEHKQAVNFLNELTDERLNIFAIQMEVWKIGDSPYAPKFQIIAKPNDWAKAIKKISTSSQELSNTKMMQLEFWTSFNEYIDEQGIKFRVRKPRPQHWYSVSFGFSIVHVELTINSQSNKKVCAIYIPKVKELFYFLFENKNEIEKELGISLQWEEMSGKKASSIRLVEKTNFLNKESWKTDYDWFVLHTDKLQKVFSSYVENYRSKK